MDINALLTKIGCTQGEQSVYVALMQLGTSTVGNIIEKSGVSSSKVYIILEKLQRKGFVGMSYKGRVKQFCATNPQTLITYLDQQMDELVELKKSATKVLETLPTPHTDDVFVYKGVKGIRNAFIDAMQSGETYTFFGSGYVRDPHFLNFILPITNMAIERMKVRGLMHTSEKKEFAQKQKRVNYEIRHLDVWWPSDITIISDVVINLLWDSKEPVAFVHKSKRMADSYRKFFEKNWKSAKK